MKTKKGISLIVLVIIIIVMSILLGAVILSIKNEDLSNNAHKVRVQTDVSAIKEELQNYISDRETEYARSGLSYLKEKLNADSTSATYDSKAIEGITNVESILPSIKKTSYKDAFKIVAGELVLTGNYNFEGQEAEWVNEILE